jgi:hypothetical protein
MIAAWAVDLPVKSNLEGGSVDVATLLQPAVEECSELCSLQSHCSGGCPAV